jgi:ferritin-like metal-binding protein YciE
VTATAASRRSERSRTAALSRAAGRSRRDRGFTEPKDPLRAKELKTLDVLFHETLKDVYFAEHKIVATLPKMNEAATSKQLKDAFTKHLAETKVHVQRLEEVFKLLGKKPEQKTCDAMMGIVKEGAEIMDEYQGMPALDAGLLAAAQAVEHYEMSRYGTLRTWALELGMKDAARLLQTTLDEEQAADIALTSIATKVVNQNAEKAA